MGSQRVRQESATKHTNKVVRLLETKSRMVVALCEGEWNGKLLINEYKISVLLDEYILEICYTILLIVNSIV